MTMERNQNQRGIQAGSEVIGSDMQYVGIVSELRDDEGDMLVTNRRTGGDIYIPFDAVDDVRDSQVLLTLPAADVDLKNWPRSATGGTVGGSPASPGPAGTGIPSGRPGWPTFEGTGFDNPGAGAGNLVGDTKANLPDPPIAGRLSRTPNPLPFDVQEEINENWVEGATEKPSDRSS